MLPSLMSCPRRSIHLMLQRILAAALVASPAGCGPESADDGTAPGTLEYEHPEDMFYRLDHRVDIEPVDPERSDPACVILTDRAYQDLVTTIEALDPTVDYDEAVDCIQTTSPKGQVHLEGFEHSPFMCDWDCCHPDLGRVALVYLVVENNLAGIELVVDGAPYVAVEPDQPSEAAPSPSLCPSPRCSMGSAVCHAAKIFMSSPTS